MLMKLKEEKPELILNMLKGELIMNNIEIEKMKLNMNKKYGSPLAHQRIPVKDLGYTINCVYYEDDYKLIYRERDDGTLITKEEAQKLYEQSLQKL